MAAGAICLAVLVTAAFVLIQRNSGGRPSVSPERQRELALYYEAKEMPHAAIEAYTAYLEHASINEQQRGAVAYSVAKLAIDVADYERALEFLDRGRRGVDPD